MSLKLTIYHRLHEIRQTQDNFYLSQISDSAYKNILRQSMKNGHACANEVSADFGISSELQSFVHRRTSVCLLVAINDSFWFIRSF